jgi:hypothetical protein
VASFRHVLGLVASGDVEVSRSIVDWLERELDTALSAYADGAASTNGADTRLRVVVGGG